MAAPAAAHALEAARREVGRRAAAGLEDASLAIDALVAALEADPDARPALDRGVEEDRRQDPLGEPWAATGARADRRRIRDAARRAVDDLVVAGELSPDGPGMVRLPGFGASTWRAVAVLRAEAPGAEGRWARAVAEEPARDLGDAAPGFLRGIAADPRLRPAAARLHREEALRQDVRHALMAAASAIGAALDAGHADSAEALRRECAELEARLAEGDRAIAEAWEAGLAAAADG